MMTAPPRILGITTERAEVPMDISAIPVMDLGQFPLELPPAVEAGIDHYTAFHDLVDALRQYGQSGPVALAWRWALTGNGPTPITLGPWDGGPPDRDQMIHEAAGVSAWPADCDQLDEARAELLTFGYDPYGDALAAAGDEPHGSMTATITPGWQLAGDDMFPPLLQPPRYGPQGTG